MTACNTLKCQLFLYILNGLNPEASDDIVQALTAMQAKLQALY